MEAETAVARSAFAARSLRGLPISFWVLWLGTLVNRLGTMVQPFLALYLATVRHVSLATTGVVLSAWGIGSLVSQPVAGVLADRIGRRATLLAGTLLTAPAMLLLSFSHALGLIVVASIALGVAVDAYRPASNALVADLVPVSERSRAYGLQFWAINLGFTGAMLAGGWLAGHDARWLFGVDGATSIAFGFMVWWVVPRKPTASEANAPPARFRDVLGDRVMMAFLGVVLIYFLVYCQSYITLPLAMHRGGLSPNEYGVAIALNGLLVVLVQPLLGKRLARLDRTRVPALGILIVGLGFGLTILASSTLSYALTVAVWTLGEVAFWPISITIVADLAPAQSLGRYNGMYGVVWSAAGLLAPALGTRLLAIGPSVLWVTCATACAAGAAAQIKLAPAIRRRVEQMAPHGAAGCADDL